MPIVTATVFATWIGSETVLGIPATFLKEGLGGVVSDPFGSSLCLILVGLSKYDTTMQGITRTSTVRPYFSRKKSPIVSMRRLYRWRAKDRVAAQIKALGLVFNVVSEGSITQTGGMMIGAASVLIYTLFGGMWSVAITDFIQMIIIVIGMLYIGGEMTTQTGGISIVIEHATAAGQFSNFWPDMNLASILGFVAVLCTMMLGSIPQQDVFQRITSSKNVNIAVNAAILGGVLYFIFAFVPMYMAYSATLIDPGLVKEYLNTDPQMILPKLILNHALIIAQVMFFGALLSAIKSCASVTLLAPSVTFAENIVRGFLSIYQIMIC